MLLWPLVAATEFCILLDKITIGVVGEEFALEFADKVGIMMANLSILRNEKAKAMRLSTLDALCRALDCPPGDLPEYKK